MKHTKTLAAGGTTTFKVYGRFLFVTAATGPFLMELKYQDGTRISNEYEQYDEIEIPAGFEVKEITLTDNSGASNTVVLRTSHVPMRPAQKDTTQKVSSTQLPASLGQKPKAGSLPVAIASDQDALPVVLSNAATPYPYRTTASTNENNIVAGACVLRGISGTNTSAGTLYLKIYDLAAAPTLASDVPVMRYALLAGQPFNFQFGESGIGFAAGLSFAITGAIGDTDTTNTAADDVVLQFAHA